MKFPMADRPFALPVAVSPAQADGYARLAHTLLLSTVREYEHLQARPAAARLPKKLWKSLKRREALTVFRRRSDRHGSLQDAEDDPTAFATFDWSLPKLVLTGAIVGSLEDVMYGTVATTGEAMRVRAVYMQDELLDADVLAALELPTPETPFRSLTLKWSVKSYASNPMIWPRDTVVLEATGVHTLQDGSSIGYRTVHSVQLPQCPELDALGIVRARMSSTQLYKQLPNGTVDVYATRFVESSGNLPDSVALAAAANSLIGCWKAVWCAQNKKLTVAAQDGALRWEVEGAGKIERLVVTTDEHGQYCCGLCLKGYKLYNSVITCQACNLMVCSRCQVGRRLARVGYQSQITQYPVLFCKNCITKSTRENAWDVASGECVTKLQAEQLASHPRARGETATVGIEDEELMSFKSKPKKATISISETARRAAQSYRGVSMATNSTFSGSLDGLEPLSFHDEDEVILEAESDDNIQTLDDWDREHVQSFYAGRRPRLSVSDSEDEDGVESPREVEVVAPTPRTVGTASGGEHQQQLWQQMTQLCMTAEETYRLAKKNAAVMRHHHQQASY